MRPTLIVVPIFMAATVALGACGSESEQAQREDRDRAEIETVAKRFDAAVAGKDAKAICALLAPQDKERLRQEKRRCLVVWGAERNQLFKARDPDLTVESLKLEPSTATAELANGGELVFLREKGTWYVNLAPAKKRDS